MRSVRTIWTQPVPLVIGSTLSGSRTPDQAECSCALSAAGLALSPTGERFHFTKMYPHMCPCSLPWMSAFELSPRYGWRIINYVDLKHISPGYKVGQTSMLLFSHSSIPLINGPGLARSVVSIKAKPTSREGNENTWKKTQLIGMRPAHGHEVHFVLSRSSVSVCRLTHSPQTCLNDTQFRPGLGRKLTCAILICKY